jgi:hypothetical protein
MVAPVGLKGGDTPFRAQRPQAQTATHSSPFVDLIRPDVAKPEGSRWQPNGVTWLPAQPKPVSGGSQRRLLAATAGGRDAEFA